MLSHKAILVSLDAIISLPIAFAAIFLLFGSYHNNISQLNSAVRTQALELRLYSKSQFLIQTLQSLNLNYTSSISVSENFSRINGINLTLTQITNTTMKLCSGLSICRIAEIQNSPYLMVIKNESPN